MALKIYLLIDTSGSMQGEPIQSVNVGVQNLISLLNESGKNGLEVCIITFDKDVNVVLSMSPVQNLRVPELITPASGPTFLGKALEEFLRIIQKDADSNNNVLFVMTDGKPSDLQVFQEVYPKVKNNSKINRIIGYAVGFKAKSEFLELFSHRVLSMEEIDQGTIQQIFDNIFLEINELVETEQSSSDDFLKPPSEEQNVFY